MTRYALVSAMFSRQLNRLLIRTSLKLLLIVTVAECIVMLLFVGFGVERHLH